MKVKYPLCMDLMATILFSSKSSGFICAILVLPLPRCIFLYFLSFVCYMVFFSCHCNSLISLIYFIFISFVHISFIATFLSCYQSSLHSIYYFTCSRITICFILIFLFRSYILRITMLHFLKMVVSMQFAHIVQNALQVRMNPRLTFKLRNLKFLLQLFSP